MVQFFLAKKIHWNLHWMNNVTCMENTLDDLEGLKDH